MLKLAPTLSLHARPLTHSPRSSSLAQSRTHFLTCSLFHLVPYPPTPPLIHADFLLAHTRASLARVIAHFSLLCHVDISRCAASKDERFFHPCCGVWAARHASWCFKALKFLSFSFELFEKGRGPAIGSDWVEKVDFFFKGLAACVRLEGASPAHRFFLVETTPLSQRARPDSK